METKHTLDYVFSRHNRKSADFIVCFDKTVTDGLVLSKLLLLPDGRLYSFDPFRFTVVEKDLVKWLSRNGTLHYR